MKYHDLEQGTPEWLEFRYNHIGASDAPVLMGESPYKNDDGTWKTPLTLWKEKIGASRPPQTNPAMIRGNLLEEPVRMEFIKKTGYHVEPKVCTHDDLPFMSASYDGLSLDGTIACEIKNVKKEFHDLAIAGEVPQAFYAQLQQQWFVGDTLKEVFYVSYYEREEDPDKRLIILPVKRDDAYIKKLIHRAKQFWLCVKDFEPPELTDKDYHWRQDEEWVRAAEKVMLYSEKESEFKRLKEEARKHLIELSQGQNVIGGGVKFTRYFIPGRVNYAKIPELKGVCLDEYRSEASEGYRITKQKD